MMKLSDIGIGKSVEMAQAPKCDCGCGGIMQIVGSNFKTKEETIGFAMSICDEWECPHTFLFVKFKNNECALGVHEPIEEDSDKYDWNVYKIKWSDIKSIRGYIAEFSDIHFAVVMEENKDGNFNMISK